MTTAMNAICSMAVPAGTQLHWSTGSWPACVGENSVVDRSCSVAGERRRTKTNGTKTTHQTQKHILALCRFIYTVV